ncbi:MAG: hypothetical protein DBX55_09600 [Verrucomicrobia bacterium]|nr:MAG: hypothetical protein DBX55_09600 [Verrucomicrobiota bacterium]
MRALLRAQGLEGIVFFRRKAERSGKCPPAKADFCGGCRASQGMGTALGNGQSRGFWIAFLRTAEPHSGAR